MSGIEGGSGFLGLPLATWLFVVIPFIISWLAPFILARLLLKRSGGR